MTFIDLERKGMDKNTFNLTIKEILERNFKTQGKVLLQKIRKNNGVILDSIIIQMPDSNISPTIYMDTFYEMYRNGMDVEEIAVRILAAYYNGKPKRELELDFFKDFNQVKSKIVYRIINAKQNEELLEEIPHVLWMDLAICCYYAFYDEQLGNGMITVNNKHMEWWKTNTQELMALACQNTPDLLKAQMESLTKVVESLCGEEIEEVHGRKCPLYVLTNEQKTQGAACILYEGMPEKIALTLGGSFYIIPSSIHELIIFKENGDEDIYSLHKMINEVNETQLSEEEILSDYPYYYDSQTKKIICLKEF